MRICVFGAGSVGGYLAGFLAEGGAEVSVIARGPHLAAIQAHGLTVETPDHTIVARVTATDDPATLPPQDAVLVTAKTPALPKVAATIAPLLGPDTPVAFVNNGIPWWYFHAHGGPLDGRQLPTLDPDGALWRNVTPQRAVGGIFWPACSVPAPGVVRLLTGAGQGTVLGAPNGASPPALLALAEAFKAGALPVTLASDIRTLIWRKLLFNLSAGPMCVLTETTVMDTQTEAALVECSRRVVAEGRSLATSMGIAVDIDTAAVTASNAKLAHRPSILQDLQAGRPMEVDALYTVPLEMARLVGLPTPTLDLLVALIKVKARAKGLYKG
ncbi:MAG: 2-dehydropantoate 2-reductase [Acetobacteraceae bacterium]|nr:2-dehydropantoate 2-reductase [Acetobacteraceae bacterium]